jgi:tRNA threonylcarbamoyladenosine biosynthesis protein TsaB
VPRILHLETTAGVCGVALSEGEGKLVELLEHEEANAHSRVLAPMVEKALASAGWSMTDLDAVAVGAGPGSYTGLRIGTATAKGLCYALNLPLIAVPTLKALASALRDRHSDAQLLVPLIDARRMEVYTASFGPDLAEIDTARPWIVENNPFQSTLDQGLVIFGGSGAEKCRELLGHKNARFEISLVPRVEQGLALAHKRFKTNVFEDVAQFEPQYLKGFWTTARKNA